MSRLVALLPVAVLALSAAASPVAHPQPLPDAEARVSTWDGTLRSGVASLTIAREHRSGYDRDLFTHWISQGDGCDTRDRVLIAEAIRTPTVSSECTLSGGRWFSYYDGVRTKDSSTFDIDHMVPLAEAWDSGARRWNADTRERFANDLGDARALVAVTASSNRSKGDQDPAEWLPSDRKCRYVKQYVAVKIRWSLSVDRVEKRALRTRADSCRDVTLKVQKAVIGRG